MRRNPIRTISLWTLSLLLLAFSGPANARPNHRGERDRTARMINPKHLDRLADQLKLSDTLRAEIKAIAFDAKAKSIDQRAALEKAQLKMKQLMDQPEPPRAAIMAQIDVISALRAEREKLKTGALLDIRAKLTPEQRAQLKDMRKDFRKKRRARGDRRHRRGRWGRQHGPRGDQDRPPEGDRPAGDPPADPF